VLDRPVSGTDADGRAPESTDRVLPSGFAADSQARKQALREQGTLLFGQLEGLRFEFSQTHEIPLSFR
jgi:hypothetical protein